jgi:hypothetical protein
MKAKIKRAGLITAAWLSVMLLLIPSLANRWNGQYSLVRLDPSLSTDYNCMFVEGHTHPSFAIPWLSRSTWPDYLRLRYTPLGDNQPYGIMFVDTKTFAYEAHSGFAKRPTHTSGRLDSPRRIRDWMRSQPHSAQAESHDGNAMEIYSAILALSQTDLEHFDLPAKTTLSHFQVGYTSPASRNRREWLTAFLALIPVWIGVFVQRKPV